MKNVNGGKKPSSRVRYTFRFWKLIVIITLFGFLLYLWIMDQEKDDANNRQRNVISLDASNSLGAGKESYNDKDDLTAISGIGKKVSMLLTAQGITTYRLLADADKQELVRLLQENNLRFMDPHDWQIQAAELAEK